MRALLTHLDTSSRALSLFLGGGAIALAAVVATTAQPVPAIGTWAVDVLSVSFVAIFLGLVYAAIFCLVRLWQCGEPSGVGIWYEAGINAANGIATLALTYTLLGIALGIGELAEKDLTPATVQGIIRGLTADFAMAFMTTVIGLPASAALRAMLAILRAWRSRPPTSTHIS